MADANDLPDPIRTLVADIGDAIYARCRDEPFAITEVATAAATILGGILRQFESPQDRQYYLEEIVRRLRQAVYGQVGSA